MERSADGAGWIEELERALADFVTAEPPLPDDLPRAAVALLLRPARPGVEVLLIRRAVRSDDPWSGHVALPGGREQADDRGPAWTAARESREEVGIDPLAGGRLLGALDPVWPRSERAPRILVRPFVFAVPQGVAAVPNHEVDSAFWLPLRHLGDPSSAIEHVLEMEGLERMTFPAFGWGEHVVWGLTHRILIDFLALASRAGLP
jgi:8-oxo-dGTP pyrophosphatase MutT (NUDIX family)